VTQKASARTKARLVELGQQLRKVRLSLGLSRAAAARLVAMDPTNYARLEKGRQNASFEMLLRVADGLGMELIVRFRKRGR